MYAYNNSIFSAFSNLRHHRHLGIILTLVATSRVSIKSHLSRVMELDQRYHNQSRIYLLQPRHVQPVTSCSIIADAP